MMTPRIAFEVCRPALARLVLFLAIALAFGALSGCGKGAPPDFVTERGVEVHLNGLMTLDAVSANELDASALFIFHHFHPEANYQQAIECLGGVEVFLLPGDFNCDGHDNAFGCQTGTTIQIRTPEAGPQGVWSSSYRHELLHRLDGCAAGDADHDHRGGEWRYALILPVNSFP